MCDPIVLMEYAGRNSSSETHLQFVECTDCEPGISIYRVRLLTVSAGPIRDSVQHTVDEYVIRGNREYATRAFDAQLESAKKFGLNMQLLDEDLEEL